MCPNCHDPMLVIELDGIEIDHCAGCGGTWLDAGELEEIAGRAGAPAGRLSESLHPGNHHARGTRRCPRCRRRMDRARPDAKGPELDRCDRGHGLWLDRGELRELLSRASADDEERAAVARFFRDLYQSELATAREG